VLRELGPIRGLVAPQQRHAELGHATGLTNIAAFAARSWRDEERPHPPPLKCAVGVVLVPLGGHREDDKQKGLGEVLQQWHAREALVELLPPVVLIIVAVVQEARLDQEDRRPVPVLDKHVDRAGRVRIRCRCHVDLRSDGQDGGAVAVAFVVPGRERVLHPFRKGLGQGRFVGAPSFPFRRRLCLLCPPFGCRPSSTAQSDPGAPRFAQEEAVRVAGELEQMFPGRHDAIAAVAAGMMVVGVGVVFVRASSCGTRLELEVGKGAAGRPAARPEVQVAEERVPDRNVRYGPKDTARHGKAAVSVVVVIVPAAAAAVAGIAAAAARIAARGL
jgi:hypothetical protein